MPLTDSDNNHFISYAQTSGIEYLNTVTTNQTDSFTAHYHNPTNWTNPYSPYPAELIYTITPNDPAVLAAAQNLTWKDILDYTSYIQHTGSSVPPQYPNQTIANGSIRRLDFSNLCCSLLCARGYTAYLVRGTSSNFVDFWVVLNLGGAFYHIDPYYSWQDQQTINFSSYQPKYYIDEKGIYSAGFSLDPSAIPPDQISTFYLVQINAVYTKYDHSNIGKMISTSASIMEDGVPTGFNTPHAFNGLIGVHNFTVPYEDSSGHPFELWILGKGKVENLPTLTVLSGGLYTATFNELVNQTDVSAAEVHYFVTPFDPAVVAAAVGKSWTEIIDYVAYPNTNYNASQGSLWLFPNETLVCRSGLCREYSDLCVSMLRSRGYIAYMALGNKTDAADWNPTTDHSNHAWVVIEFDNKFYSLEPQSKMATQPLHNFNCYQAEFFVDENGIYPAQPSLDPQLIGVNPTPTPPPTSNPTPTPSPNVTPSPASTSRATAKPSTNPTPTPISPPSSIPTAKPTDTTTQVPPVESGNQQFLPIIVLLIVIVIVAPSAVLVYRRKKRQNFE